MSTKEEKKCRHLAIIMDGNGRWAKAQGKPRSAGHLAGADNVRTIAIAADELGVEYLQGYYFSKPIPEQKYLEFLEQHK